jgi:hypothetical protein
MQIITADSHKRSGLAKCLMLSSLLLTAVPGAEVLAYYPYNPWSRPFQAVPYSGYMPGYYGPGMAPRWPGYYPGRPFSTSPLYRTFNYQRPWGSIHGRVSADGNFWVNIRFGGHYRDLQYLMGLMQMSGNMQMQLDNVQPVLPQPDFDQDDQWPM